MIRACLAALVALVASALTRPAFARAPDTFEEQYSEPIIIESPMWWAFEFKLGPYTPDYDAFKDTFNDDRGWLLGVELDALPLKIPYVGQAGVGLGWGWSSYKAKALTQDGTRSGETTKLVLYPMSLLAVLRVDALARHTVVPLAFAGKLGADFVRWTTETGGSNDAGGLNKGFRWGLSAALELDFFDPKAARSLDEEYGVNHTYLMFELFESKTDSTGDKSFQFGFAASF